MRNKTPKARLNLPKQESAERLAKELVWQMETGKRQSIDISIHGSIDAPPIGIIKISELPSTTTYAVQVRPLKWLDLSHFGFEATDDVQEREVEIGSTSDLVWSLLMASITEFPDALISLGADEWDFRAAISAQSIFNPKNPKFFSLP